MDSPRDNSAIPDLTSENGVAGGWPSPEVEQRWGRYLIEKLLAKGGQALVFQACDQVGAAGHVALKTPKYAIAPERVRNWIASYAEPLTELDHPNIVQIRDAGEVGGVPYVATELIRGLPLKNHVENSPPSLAQMLDWAIDLTDALDQAHKRGIVHCDVKPRNIIFSLKGEPLIIDFGISSLVTAYEPERGLGYFATPAYMAPEQARGDQDADHRVDIFGLGAVVKYLMAETGPYGRKERDEDYVQAAKEGQVQMLDCDVDPRKRRALARIANRAMDPEPDRRYRNMGEMLHALRRVRNRPRFIAATVGAVVLVAAVVLGAMMLPDAGRQGAATGPIKAGLEIHFQRARQTGVYQVLTADAVPLHSGDRIQIHAEFDRMLVPYLVAVTSEGQVRVLHPDQGGKAEPARKVQFPPGKNEWVELTPPGGTETIILLAAERPVDDVSKFSSSRLNSAAFPVRPLGAVVSTPVPFTVNCPVPPDSQ